VTEPPGVLLSGEIVTGTDLDNWEDSEAAGAGAAVVPGADVPGTDEPETVVPGVLEPGMTEPVDGEPDAGGFTHGQAELPVPAAV